MRHKIRLHSLFTLILILAALQNGGDAGETGKEEKKDAIRGDDEDLYASLSAADEGSDDEDEKVVAPAAASGEVRSTNDAKTNGIRHL